MPCENCSAQFTVFKRKRACCECDRFYCGNCLGKGSNSPGAGLCGACRILCNRQIDRRALDHLRVRDLQCFLHRQNISTRGCIEKEELITLVIAHVNSGNFKRRNPQSSTSEFFNAFPSIRGFTTNLNNVFTSAFDNIGSNNNNNNGRQQRQTRPGASNRVNATSPTSSFPNNPTTSNAAPNRTNNRPKGQPRSPPQFQPTPHSPSHPQFFTLNGERPTIIIPPEASNVAADAESTLEPTTDCLEIEDIEDSAEWEFIRRPADPLPQDSSELLTNDTAQPNVEQSAEVQETNEVVEVEVVEVEVRTEVEVTASAESSANIEVTANVEVTPEPSIAPNSSDNETSYSSDNNRSNSNLFNSTRRVDLFKIKNASEIENLTAKQLKELLAVNRVDFKGCCEKNELLERVMRLWRETNKSREDLDMAPTEELCKICMDAPMECVMLECGHIATCIACGKQLNECPICRQFVVRVVRFFKS